jgi:hypothetical protein
MGSHGASDERLRTPGFPCVDEAKIICLPSEGLVLPGRLRDLSALAGAASKRWPALTAAHAQNSFCA